MAVPLLAAVPAGLAKLKAGLAALKGLGAAKGAATQLTIPGLTAAGKTGGAVASKGILGNAKRMAGDALYSYLGEKPTLGNLATNFGFDAGFGILQGITTPGDLGDKVIAGVSSGLG